MSNFIINFIKRIKDNSILYLINTLIVLVWIFFIYLNWITKRRLIIFFFILFIIFLYKFLYNYLQNNKYKIRNKKIINFLMDINKYKNPFLLLILYLEEKIFDILCIYNNKWLIKLIYLIFLFLINPLKILFYTISTLVLKWNSKKYNKIILIRMLGLILSILIFTNIIFYLKYILGLNLLGLIYLYFLIKSICTEFYKREDIRFKSKRSYREYFILFFLMMNFNTLSIIVLKTTWSLISLLLEDNMRHHEQQFNYFLKGIDFSKIEKFYIHDTWNTLNSIKNFKNKPSYTFYEDLENKITAYMSRINDYIIFKVYNWDIPNIQEYASTKDVKLNSDNFLKLRKIYEYDYKIFRLYLFIYFDLEKYLDQIKNNNVLSIFHIEEVFGDFYYLRFMKVKLWRDQNIRNIENQAYYDTIQDKDDFNRIIKDKDNFDLNLELNKLFLDIVDNYDLYIPVTSNLNLFTSKERELNDDLLFYQKIDDMLWISVLKDRYLIKKEDYELLLKELYQEWNLINENERLVKYKELLSEINIELEEIKKIKID